MKAEPCGCRPIRTPHGEYLPKQAMCSPCRHFFDQCHAKAVQSCSESMKYLLTDPALVR